MIKNGGMRLATAFPHQLFEMLTKSSYQRLYQSREQLWKMRKLQGNTSLNCETYICLTELVYKKYTAARSKSVGEKRERRGEAKENIYTKSMIEENATLNEPSGEYSSIFLMKSKKYLIG